MKLFQLKPLNSTIFLALVFGGLLLLTTAVGCGDDDDDGSTAGSGGSAAGSGGAGSGGSGGAGSGGSGGAGSGGSGGTTGGTGGEPVPVATAEEKQTACQCMRDNGTMPLDDLVAVCIDNVSDECVACVNDIATSCTGMDATAFDSCVTKCGGTIPPPTTVERCKELVVAGADNDTQASVGACVCEKCLDTMAPCIVNPACLRIVKCGADQACGGTNCLNDPVCITVIGDQAAVDPNAINIAMPMGQCVDTSGCVVIPDAGTAGAGGADAG